MGKLQTKARPEQNRTSLFFFSLPRQRQMTVIGNAVFQVQIDQGLVRDTHHFGLLLEVINGIAVNVNGDLFFSALA